MSLLVTMALALHVVERSIPVPFVTPGAKLGLANLVTVLALYSLPSKVDTLKIIITRVILGMIFGGNASSFLYSFIGAMLSFVAMIVVKEGLGDKVSIIGVSATGAVFHNIGQILVACMILRNLAVSLYLPMLSIAGIVTGIFIGMSTNYIIAHIFQIRKINFNKYYE